MQKLKSLLETQPVKSSSKSSIFKTTGTSIMQKPQTQSQLQLRSQVTTEDKIKTAEITSYFTNSIPIDKNINTVSTKKDYYLNKLPINLEDVLLQEEKLWMILCSIRFQSDYTGFAEEYLDFSSMSSIQTYEIFFNQKKFKNALHMNAINEYLVVMLSVLSVLTNKITEESMKHIKNLLYYLHQNILLIISLIISRMDKEYIDNIWGNQLKEIIFHRLSSDMKGNDEEFFINQNNKIIINMLENYIDIYFRTKSPFDIELYKFISSIITSNYSKKFTLSYIKSTLTKKKIQLINVMMMTRAINAMKQENPPAPYLPPIDRSKYKYSLVLDLDETLVHSIAETGRSLIRPGLDQFLTSMAKYYEIVIFTAATQEYADNLLNLIDKGRNLIKYRLYRQHTTVTDGVHVKDISKLGRDLSKTIIIDNISDNFQRQQENGIFITTWMGDQTDTELYDLIPVLEEIVIRKVKDVRKILRKLRDTIIRLYVKGDERPLDTLKRQLSSGNISQF